MRLVRFEDESGAFAVDLHPMITVVSGLPLHIRERLVHALASLPGGADPGGRGTLEVHGVYLDLNRDSLSLLELNQDLDVVLRASDLPGADAQEPAGKDGLSEDAGDTDDEVELAKAALSEAEGAYEAASSTTAHLKAQLAEIERERAQLESELSAARAGLDSYAAAGVRVARDEVSEILARVDVPGLDPYRADREAIEERLSELISEADRLKRQLKNLRSIDTLPVRQAFAALEMATGASEPGVDTKELIAEWNDLSHRQVASSARRASGRSMLVELTSRRDRAYDDLAAAERALTATELDPALVEQLETTHDEIFELEGRTSKLGAAKIRRRVEQLRATQDDLLVRLGFDTWSSYIMGHSNNVQDPARYQRYDVAKSAYEFAEDELARAAAVHAPTDPEVEELDAERADLLRRAQEILGFDPGPDPVPALLEHRSEPTHSESIMRPEDAAAALRLALEETGAEMPARSMTFHELRSLATGWLDAMSGLGDRLTDVAETRADVEAEISELADRLEHLPDQALTAPTDHGSAELSAAQARLVECQERAKIHEDSIAAIATVEARLQRLDDRANDLHAAVSDRDRRLAELSELREAARNRWRRAESAKSAHDENHQEPWRSAIGIGAQTSGVRGGSAGAEAVEWYVLARLAQQRSVSFVGSVPLVIDDAFLNWPVDALNDVFERLERMGEVIQIVFITEDPEVGNWGRRLGTDKALVLDMRISNTA